MIWKTEIGVLKWKKKEEKEKLTWMHIQQSWLDGSCSDDQDKWIFWNWTDILSWYFTCLGQELTRRAQCLCVVLCIGLHWYSFYISWKVINKGRLYLNWSVFDHNWFVYDLLGAGRVFGVSTTIPYIYLFISCNLLTLDSLHCSCVDCCLNDTD